MGAKEQTPYERFLETVSQFMRDPTPGRHFGRLFLSSANGHGEEVKLEPFRMENSAGLFLARLLIEREGWLCGMVTRIVMDNNYLILTMYNPELVTEVIPLERVAQFQVMDNPHGRFVIENGRLEKRNGSPSTASEGQNEPNPTPIITEASAVSA